MHLDNPECTVFCCCITKTTREERGSKEATTDEQNANKNSAESFCAKGSLVYKGNVHKVNLVSFPVENVKLLRGAGKGLFCKIFRFLQSLRHFPMKMPPPNLRSKFIHQGRLIMVEPVYG